MIFHFFLYEWVGDDDDNTMIAAIRAEKERGKKVGKEVEEEKQDQIALLWNAIIDLEQRVRKLERRLGSLESEYENKAF